MAEPSKGKSPCADQKKKKSSFLDEEIDDDFLSSWKSTSLMKDDGMDFSFSTGTKSKKKVFEFDKLPRKKDAKTKKVDMADLDISSPPKKAAKTKESEEEPSRGSRQGKEDRFRFSFDFKELDSFDLDSTLSRKEKSYKKEDGIKVVISDGAGSESSEVDLAEGISTLDGDSETVATSKIDTMLVDSGNTISKDCASNSESPVSFQMPPNSRYQEKVMCHGRETSNKEVQVPEKAVSIELDTKQTIHDLPAGLVPGVYANMDLGVDGKNGSCLQIKNINTSFSGKEAANEKMLIEDGPNNENLLCKSSSPLDAGGAGSSYSDMSILDSDTLTENAESANNDSDNGETLATVVSSKTPHDSNSIEGNENSKSKPPLSTQSSKSTEDDVTLRKESGAGTLCSNSSKRLEDTGAQLLQSSFVGEKSLASGNNRIGSMYVSPEIEKRVTINSNDAQHGSKILTTQLLVDKEAKARPRIPRRGTPDSDGIPNKTKIVRDSQQCDKKVTGKETFVGTEQRQNLKDLSSSSSTGEIRKYSSQSVKPPVMVPDEPLRNSKIVTAEVVKHCPEKTAQKKFNISTWKISKNIGGTKYSLGAATQKEVKTLRSSEKNKELHHNVKLETSQMVYGSEKMRNVIPLKRKSFEGLGPGLASLKLPKRMSPSPREIRISSEPSEGTIEQVCLLENHPEIKTKSPTSKAGSMVNVMELEPPSAMEADENVEKAEAYTKELEDICNMLKRKHEEAKELLVRAVVNNNNLLMLNHPIYEAKIHKVQKFAAKLASKELQVC